MEAALHSLANLQSETVVKPADKPINCNNKHIQTMFLIIWPDEELLHSSNTFMHAVASKTVDYTMEAHCIIYLTRFKDYS